MVKNDDTAKKPTVTRNLEYVLKHFPQIRGYFSQLGTLKQKRTVAINQGRRYNTFGICPSCSCKQFLALSGSYKGEVQRWDKN